MTHESVVLSSLLTVFAISTCLVYLIVVHSGNRLILGKHAIKITKQNIFCFTFCRNKCLMKNKVNKISFFKLLNLFQNICYKKFSEFHF